MNKSGYIIVNQGEHAVGLQDKDGREILPCIYDEILDYDDDGYIATRMDDVKGFLNEYVDFTIFKRQPVAKYIYIATYRHNVAPAHTPEGKWVFIDRDKKRINDY